MLTRKEFNKVLNYMLQLQVIDNNEYMNLQMKMLPYLKK